MFNITTFLDEFGAKEYNEYNYTMPCPKCGKEENHFQVSINPDNRVCHCFKCGFKSGWTGLVAILKRISYKEAQEIVDLYVFSSTKPKKKVYDIVNFPIASCWTDEAYEYLLGRGLTEQYIRDKGIYFCHFGDKYKNRVIFPIAQRQAFQARSVDNRHPKYLSSPGIGRFLYGSEELSKSKSVILVEGIFDQIAVRKAGYDAVASFSKKISSDQILLLRSMEVEEISIMFDGDAYEATIRYFYELNSYFRRVNIIPVGDKDPGECEDIHSLVAQKIDSIEEFKEIKMRRFRQLCLNS